MTITMNKFVKMGLILAILAAITSYPLYEAFRAKNPCLALFCEPQAHEIEQTLQQIEQAQTTVAHTLKEQLTQENSQLLTRIPLAFPQIHPVQWENAMKALQRLKNNDNLVSPNGEIPAAHHPFITTIYTTLAEYGINPARVEIEYVKTPQSFLSACQSFEKGKIRHIIRVNMSEVEKKSDEVALAYLRHEIQHLLTYDAIEMMIVKDVLEKNDVSSEEYYADPDFIALKKFKEYRADLLAAAHGMDTAQAFMHDMQERIKKFPHEQTNPTHSTHPTETERHAAITNLVKYMEQQC